MGHPRKPRDPGDAAGTECCGHGAPGGPALKALRRNRLDGFPVPGAAAQMACAVPWAGMAYGLGYMRAAMQSLGIG